MASAYADDSCAELPVPLDGHRTGSVRAQGYAQRAEQVANEEAPELEVETEVIELPPIQALMNASRNADLLVVGRRGLGGLRGLLLGSVSQHCAEHAQCPVVIIPAIRGLRRIHRVPCREQLRVALGEHSRLQFHFVSGVGRSRVPSVCKSFSFAYLASGIDRRSTGQVTNAPGLSARTALR